MHHQQTQKIIASITLWVLILGPLNTAFALVKESHPQDVSSLIPLNSAESQNSTSSIQDRIHFDPLAYYEKTIFGEPTPSLSLEERVSKLEKVLFGQVQSGDLSKRQQHLLSVLNKQQPIPPELQSSPAQAQGTEPAGRAPEGISSGSNPSGLAPEKSNTHPPQLKPMDGESDYPTISKYEYQLFGKSYIKEDITVRLSRIEKTLFGKDAHKDALVDRMDHISQRLSTSVSDPSAEGAHPAIALNQDTSLNQYAPFPKANSPKSKVKKGFENPYTTGNNENQGDEGYQNPPYSQAPSNPSWGYSAAPNNPYNASGNTYQSRQAPTQRPAPIPRQNRYDKDGFYDFDSDPFFSSNGQTTSQQNQMSGQVNGYGTSGQSYSSNQSSYGSPGYSSGNVGRSAVGGLGVAALSLGSIALMVLGNRGSKGILPNVLPNRNYGMNPYYGNPYYGSGYPYNGNPYNGVPYNGIPYTGINPYNGLNGLAGGLNGIRPGPMGYAIPGMQSYNIPGVGWNGIQNNGIPNYNYGALPYNALPYQSGSSQTYYYGY
ncbi:MAG: hypothetical protein K2X66_06425 [Cyanobacteria bacterium]|nr:hypothetical protein [Cyanobacteriota bacterium]